MLKKVLVIVCIFWFWSCEATSGGTAPTPDDTLSSSDSILPTDTIIPQDSVIPRDTVPTLTYTPPHQFADVPVIAIYTTANQEIAADKNYVPCAMRVLGQGIYADYFSQGVQIKTRGNSTLKYYPKKPYRIKLPKKAAILGMESNKDWVLLANYRDPTFMMNVVAFEMAHYLEMGFVNSNRFAEVYVNDEYLGLYQVTEQIEAAKSRVDIPETGVLYHLDLDDGPELAPQNTDNFSSQVYHLPVNIKFPKNPTSAQLAEIKSELAVVEQIIKQHDYRQLTGVMDVQSMIDFLIIQELTRNVELVSPRSMYMYSGADKIINFGPVWDFDGGFAFDWASMSSGHNYFSSQSWLMGASNPSTYPHTAYNKIPGFFVDMFANREFVQAYQNRWLQVNAGLQAYIMQKIDEYENLLDSALTRNRERWPIGKSHTLEIANLKQWLQTRMTDYTAIVQGY